MVLPLFFVALSAVANAQECTGPIVLATVPSHEAQNVPTNAVLWVVPTLAECGGEVATVRIHNDAGVEVFSENWLPQYVPLEIRPWLEPNMAHTMEVVLFRTDDPVIIPFSTSDALVGAIPAPQLVLEEDGIQAGNVGDMDVTITATLGGEGSIAFGFNAPGTNPHFRTFEVFSEERPTQFRAGTLDRGEFCMSLEQYSYGGMQQSEPACVAPSGGCSTGAFGPIAAWMLVLLGVRRR